ncbi:hypothetical protein [Streptomyces sp. TBY4]|uniref:hypothetical protein n=1 Tax=Streptomyces sp. TBY4 TaxID=2962030 RepID=UPI0020B827AC|nr:hypothetical protein [Streptomyces sp. TBY4]MCP3755740.1 hypothetical protein [Streptomyces sp. TBY4]
MTDVAARNRRNRRRGADWESELRDRLREAGFDIERLRLTGKDDEGDHIVRRPGGRPLIIEAKNATFKPSVFVREAQRERDNYARHRGLAPADVDAVAIVRRRGASWREAYVLTTVAEYFGLPGEADR